MLNEQGESGVSLDDEDWQFLIENQVIEMATPIARTIADGRIVQVQSPSAKQFRNRARDYFLTIPPEEAKDRLYWLATRKNLFVVDWSLDVIKDGQLLDIPRLRGLLDSDRFLSQKRALEVLLAADQPYYTEHDKGDLRELKRRIENGFEKKGEVREVEKSGMFSSGTERVWQIEDGEPNPMDQEYDAETGLNIYGFSEEEIKPDEAVRVLDTKIAALERRFDGTAHREGG
jgi:hypothetical protein